MTADRLEPQPTDAPAPGDGRLAFELAAASFVVLFQELALIRWLPGQLRVLAYYPNLILISAFLGLGVGCVYARRRSLQWLWPLSLIVLSGAAALLSGVVFTQETATEHLFLLYYDLPRDAPVVRDIRPPIVLFFVLGAATFVPLGQWVAQRLLLFGRRGQALTGYCWDIVGSILGIVAFTLFSFAGSFPAAWFGFLLLAGALFYRDSLRSVCVYGALAVVVLATVASAERADRYSPYYALSARPAPSGSGAGVNPSPVPRGLRRERSSSAPEPPSGSSAGVNPSPVGLRGERSSSAPEPPSGTGVQILANGSLHQYALALERERPLELPLERHVRDGYHAPYRRLGRPPRHALVIGAGTGNDVAVLLDEGAERIDAVEIDPGILELGGELHPNRPYASPRVRRFNADARTFLNTTQERYDLIVFGTLDSMTRLSALSSVRLDNFVYTLECLRSARSRLTADGGLVLYFMAGTDYIDLRLAGMVADAFGEVPLVDSTHYGLFNRLYMAGPAFAADDGAARRAGVEAYLKRIEARTELPTDDWPYLYLARRGVTAFYVQVTAALIALSLLALLAASPEVRRSVRQGADAEMFLLGLGFLLLETGSVTRMNLVWGATWLTSAVVFTSVLLMILLAALAVRARRPPYGVAMAAFAVATVAAYLVPIELVMQAAWPARLAASLALTGAPIFFASMCFSILFATRPSPDHAFGWNVLGAVFGGLLEVASMEVGLRALLLVALAAYLAALWVKARSGSQPRAAAGPGEIQGEFSDPA